MARVTFQDILRARREHPERVHDLAARRLLETVGSRSLTIIVDEPVVRDELERRGDHRPLGLKVTFETEDGGRGCETFRCVIGQTLRQAGRLGKKINRPVLFSGEETADALCILRLGGGLVRCGPRDAEGLTRAYETLRGVEKVRFDYFPWGWMETVMQDVEERRPEE